MRNWIAVAAVGGILLCGLLLHAGDDHLSGSISETLTGSVSGTLSGFPARTPAGQSERLGKTDFPISCAPAAQNAFARGLALMHSFQYMEAEQAFTESSERDSKCAMAYWGRAIVQYEQLWGFPNPETLAKGRGFIETAQKLDAGTARERAYISAVAAFYQDDPKLSHVARTQAYSLAMEKLHRDYPGDDEAAAFYALSLVSLADDGEQEQANRKKAIAILQPLFLKEPDNPGPAHYLIHATDTPEFAAEGLAAARRYAQIAPDSSHALHMPSHIFTRLGLWKESIDSNLAAAKAAAKATETHTGEPHYQLHAMDYLDYAYLQSGQEAKARGIVDEVKHVPGWEKGHDEDVADRESYFAARNAIELHRWKEAASLPVPAIRLRWQDTTYWARAIGAARSGDVEGARTAVNKLSESVAAREAEQKNRGDRVVAGKATDLSEAEAWLAYAEGKSDQAVATLRSAAEREEKEGLDSTQMPAREMLADMLLELKRPSDALVEYQAVLKESPNRFDALYGGARAAKAAGNEREASVLYADLLKVSRGDADRPELAEARERAANVRN